MNLLENLKKHNLNLLVSQIKANGGHAEASIESVIKNIDKLAEKGIRFGEDVKFLPISVRRTLLSLNEGGRIIFEHDPTTLKWAQDGSWVTLGGYLVEYRDDGSKIKLSSLAVGNAVRDEVFQQDMLSDAKRESLMLSLASSRAESNAIYNAGFFIEYKSDDVFELDKNEEQIPIAAPEPPQVTSLVERKEKRKKKAKKEENTEENTESSPASNNESANDDVQQVINMPDVQEQAEDATIIEEANETSEDMSYDQALLTVIDNGHYAGQTVKEVISDPRTSRNIAWLLNNPPEAGRDAKTEKALQIVIDNFAGGRLRQYCNK